MIISNAHLCYILQQYACRYASEHQFDLMHCVQDLVIGLAHVAIDPCFESKGSSQQVFPCPCDSWRSAVDLHSLRVHVLSKAQFFCKLSVVNAQLELQILPRVTRWFDDLVQHQGILNKDEVYLNLWVFFTALGMAEQLCMHISSTSVH